VISTYPGTTELLRAAHPGCQAASVSALTQPKESWVAFGSRVSAAGAPLPEYHQIGISSLAVLERGMRTRNFILCR
jgi:hypothetical protein